jgi:HD superfamily phosphodiesterase
MKMSFHLTAKMTVLSGDYKRFGLINNCTPHDKSVVDAVSAEAHERGHISDIKSIVVAAMDAEEAKPYPSKEACDKATKAAVKRVNKVFQQAVQSSRNSRK